MATRLLPTPTELRQLLDYNPETGKLFWKERPVEMFAQRGRVPREQGAKMWNNRWAGREAFTATGTAGYKVGALNFVNSSAHRVIWALHYGEWPKEQIDHINGIRDDNRISNLREVSDAENKKNTKRRADNKSGQQGVSWYSKIQKWSAEIKVDGRKLRLGQFSALPDAIAARKLAEKKYGYHENHGREAISY